MGTENRREEALVPHVRPGNIKTTTYTMLEAQGDTSTVLRPVTRDEALADISQNGHGHVVPRADGAVARCGGPAMCSGCKAERQILEDLTEKHRASYLTVSQQYDINVACKPLQPFGYGTYHVGSSLTRPDYRDVDLRCILADDEFDQMFGQSECANKRLLFLNTAVSEWLAARTGLPIDFQFQRATEANAEFKGRRNAVGL